MSLPRPADGLTCLITGASSGIGAALAKDLASRGYHLTITARRTRELQELAEALEARYGTGVEVVTCDLGSERDRKALVDSIAASGRRVGVLINNAGFATVGRFDRLAGDREAAVIRVCAEAPAALCETFVPDMVQHGEGAILNVASIVAFAPTPGMATYAASKAFVLSFTNALHAELAPHGVTASVLAPGAVRTGFAEAAGRASLAERIPERFWSSSDEIASIAIEGLAGGRLLIVPGRAYRALAFISGHAPRRPMLWILGRQLDRLLAA